MSEKPAPEMLAEFTVTGMLPVELREIDCVDGVLRLTPPNEMLAALTMRAAVPAPVPLRLTVEEPEAAVLAKMSWPVAAPTDCGANCTVSVTDWLGFRVAGSVMPDVLNPEPVRVIELSVTATLPVEVMVMVCEAVELMATLPNETVDAPTVRAGTAAVSCRAKLCETPPALAERLAV